MLNDEGSRPGADEMDMFLNSVFHPSQQPTDDFSDTESIIAAATAIANGSEAPRSPKTIEHPLYTPPAERAREREEQLRKAWEHGAIRKELAPEHMRLMSVVNETLLYNPQKKEDMPITYTEPALAGSSDRTTRFLVFDAPGGWSIATRAYHVQHLPQYLKPGVVRADDINSIPTDVREGKDPFLPRDDYYLVSVGAINWETGAELTASWSNSGVLSAKKTNPVGVEKYGIHNKDLWKKGKIGYNVDIRSGTSEDMGPKDFDQLTHGLEQRKVNPILTQKAIEWQGGTQSPTTGPFGANFSFVPGVGFRI